MKIPISDIKPPRGKLRNPSAVAVYAQRLRAGEQAPPITLWKLRTGLFKFYIEDGDHRYLAAQSIGAQFIAARRFVIASSRNKNRSHRNSRTLHTNQLPTVAIVKAALQTQRRRNAPGEVGDIACAVALERLLSVLNGCDEATRPRSALDCMFDSIFHRLLTSRADSPRASWAGSCLGVRCAPWALGHRHRLCCVVACCRLFRGARRTWRRPRT
jgi:hypothetical protein